MVLAGVPSGIRLNIQVVLAGFGLVNCHERESYHVERIDRDAGADVNAVRSIHAVQVVRGVEKCVGHFRSLAVDHVIDLINRHVVNLVRVIAVRAGEDSI